MKHVKFLFLFSLVAIFFSCANSSNTTEVNYYSKTGLVVPKFSNQKLNEHLKSFEPLFNELGAAAASKDKEKSYDLSKAYSDWLLKGLDFKESLSKEEQQQLDAYLESTTKPWDEFKDQLF